MKHEPTTRIVHPNGLSLDLPASLSARQVADGFLTGPPGGEDRRSPVQASVHRRTGPVPPPGDWPEARRVGDRLIHYRVQEEAGGSGGPESALSAWTPYPGGFVQVEQVSQAEGPASPDHSLAWKVLAALREPAPAPGGAAP